MNDNRATDQFGNLVPATVADYLDLYQNESLKAVEDPEAWHSVVDEVSVYVSAVLDGTTRPGLDLVMAYQTVTHSLLALAAAFMERGDDRQEWCTHTAKLFASYAAMAMEDVAAIHADLERKAAHGEAVVARFRGTLH